MTKKVTIIGDCQAGRLLQHWTPYDPVDLTFWSRSGQSAWKFEPQNSNFLKIKSSKIEEAPYYMSQSSGDIVEAAKNMFTIPFLKIKDGGTVLVWLGYIDIKVNLPKNKNTEECVLKYLNSIKNYFKNSKIFLAEPFPQFIPYIGMANEKLEEWDWQIRKKRNDEFLYFLKKHAANFGFKIIITQQDIFNALGISQEDMVFEIARLNIDGTTSDTFNSSYMEKIYNLFIKKLLIS